MVLGINRAGLTHRLEYDLMPAAGTAPLFVVLGCPDGDILFTVGAVSRFRALFAVLVEDEVLRDADLANPLVPILGLCGCLGEVCVPRVCLAAMAYFQLVGSNALLVLQDAPVITGLGSEIVQHYLGILFRDPPGSTHVIRFFPEEAIQLCSQPALFLIVIGNPAVRFLIHEHGIRRHSAAQTHTLGEIERNKQNVLTDSAAHEQVVFALFPGIAAVPVFIGRLLGDILCGHTHHGRRRF